MHGAECGVRLTRRSLRGRAQEVPQQRAASLTAWTHVTLRPEVTVIPDCTADIRSASRPPCPPF